MRMAFKILRDFPWFLWSGWGSISSIMLFLACWDIGAQMYGSLILPSPKETFEALFLLFSEPSFKHDLLLTMQRAGVGFGLSIGMGTVLGLLAGRFITASIMSRPIVTILTGIRVQIKICTKAVTDPLAGLSSTFLARSED